MFVNFRCSGPVSTNTLVIACEKSRQAAIIDAAADSAGYVEKMVENHHLTPVMLLLTHSHWDHIVDASKIKARWSLPLYVHSEDAPNLKKPGADGLPLPLNIEPVSPDYNLEEGSILQLGSLKIEVIHTPGHSPGSVSFYVPQEKILFSGDTLFKGSMGRVNLPRSDPEKMWASLERLAKLPSDTRVIPGHGEETTIGSESWIKNAKHHFGESL